MWMAWMECEGSSDSGVVWWWRGVSLKHDWFVREGGFIEGVWV